MSRYRTAVGWSAGMLATAAAALLTASATLPGSAASLEVDGGVLQVFVLDGPENLPGPPDGVPPGPPDGLPPGPPDGVVTGPPADDSEDPSAGPQDPSDQPSDEQQKPDEASDEPDKPEESTPSPSDPDPGQQQSERDSKDEDSTKAATTSALESEVRYENCAQAREAGAAPLDSGDPGYRPELDDDRDGSACEQGEG